MPASLAGKVRRRVLRPALSALMQESVRLLARAACLDDTQGKANQFVRFVNQERTAAAKQSFAKIAM
jgi:hypothetical protein